MGIFEIFNRFDDNLERVDNLLDIYQKLRKSSFAGKPKYLPDIIRAALVLMHASLEDLLRNLMILKYPSLAKEHIDKIPLKGMSRNQQAPKFHLGELLQFKGQTIENIVIESIKEFANKQSFNNTDDISGVLKKMGITINGKITQNFSNLQEFIQRRHQIVHWADKDNKNNKTKAISMKAFEKWRKSIDAIVLEISIQLQSIE